MCVCVCVCGLHSDSRFYTATVGMHQDSGEQKEDSLSLSSFSFTRLALLELVCATHTYKLPVESVLYVYRHAYRRWSFAVAKGKSGSLKAKGMKREGEEGEELKLPGKERNRVGLNLLDCFQLHASSYSLSLPLSLFIPFFLSLFSLLLSGRRSSTIPLCSSLPHLLGIPRCGEKTFDGRAESIRVDPIHLGSLLGLIGHFLLSICD